MTAADWALVISLFSLALSILSFVWNVWSKFIYPKPRVAVSAGIYQTLRPGSGLGKSFVRMTAVNRGPNEVTITHAIVGELRLWPRKPRMMGLLQLMVTHPDDELPQYDLWGDGQLPKKLAVGEEFAVNLALDADLFEGAKGERRLGFPDTFGRYHWAPKQATRKLKADLQEKRAASPES